MYPTNRNRLRSVLQTTKARRIALLAGLCVLLLSGFNAWFVNIRAAHAASYCQVSYTVTNQWQGGFGANLSIENTSPSAWSSWTLTFSFPASGQTVTQLWNGSFSQSGQNVTVTNISYNGAVAANASVNPAPGFNGTWTSSNPVPTNFAINGNPCNDTGGTTPTPTSGTTPTATPTSGTTPTATPTFGITPTAIPSGAHQMERMNRGLMSVAESNGNLVSWRLLVTDPVGVGFNVYRGSTRLNSTPLTGATDYLDTGGSASSTYTVRAVVNGVEQAASETSINVPSSGYLTIPIQRPAGGTTPDGVSYTYSANDASVADLDGDGQYEIILKWDPSNSHDNSQSGYTGNVYVDAYKMNGTRLWRIDLGRNIRAGAHYTQFQVWDYDGDGKAEVAMKTADGTIDGTGKVIGNASADYRNSDGYILSGPEYLTMFNGQTGAAMATVNYDPPRGTVSSWGDSYGNRVDRFLAGTAYLDGVHPSLIVSRGYYTRTVIVAWDFHNGQLTERWKFDSNDWGSQYTYEGDHQLSIADVDGDGKDEIIFGAMAIDDNGHPLWNTNMHHGDAEHVGDLDPSRPGLEVFKVDEDSSKPASWMADARTGQILWQTAPCCDNGRGVSDHIWSGTTGAQSWSAADPSLMDVHGNAIGRKPSSTNFVVWWDGSLDRDLLDATHIDRYGTSSDTRLLTASGVHSNNGTKSTPTLSADLFGDWREEVIWPTSDDTALRIYVPTATTTYRLPTLMQDLQYRESIAWQNTAYNQPPHTSFYIGEGMATPPLPKIYIP